MLIAALHVVAVAAGVAHADSADVPEPSLRAWLGLANSDDQGTRFDVRVEVLKNGVLVAEGELRCVTGVTRNPARALAVDIPVSPFEESIAPGDELAVRILARIGTTPTGAFCGGHASAVGLLLYYDGASRRSSLTADVPLRRELFLRTAGTHVLDPAPPTAATPRSLRSPVLRLAQGNMWQLVGTWSRALRYTITELGTLGGAQSFARSINNLGQITGNASIASGQLHAFFWDAGVMTDLGILPGGNFSRGFGINDLGQVTGESDNNIPKAFLFTPGVPGLVNIGTLAGGASAFGADLNDSGQIVGSSSNGMNTRAFLYSGGTMRDLGTLRGTTNAFARAWGINASGEVVGLSNTADGATSHATLWSGSEIIDLGSLAGSGAFSEALKINDAGQIVGRSTITVGGQRATLWEDGQIHDLGTVQGLRFSRANDINASGLIVGTASQFEGFSGRAFRWRDGAIADLNDLIPSGSGWVLTSAEGLNDHGQIVGFGTRGGQTRAYLLMP